MGPLEAGRDENAHPSLPARGADLESAPLLVLERKLQLRAAGDRPALLQVNVLLNDFSHPQIADRPGGRVHACLYADWHAQSLRRERTEALTMGDSATSIVTRGRRAHPGV
jgi:hypothetical protein